MPTHPGWRLAQARFARQQHAGERLKTSTDAEIRSKGSTEKIKMQRHAKPSGIAKQ
jgi:hypothetical protein